MRFLAIPTFLALAACSSPDPARPWELLYEREPGIRVPDDAKPLHAKLAARLEATLEECVRLAVLRSEALAASAEEIVRLQALYDQTVGAVLPRLSFKGAVTFQDPTPEPGSQATRRDYKFNLKQPLFGGLREYAAIRQNEALTSARENDLRHARRLLGGDVAEAFYAVLQVERDVATTGDSLRLGQERLEELLQRQKLGIARRSEVLAQQAEVASTRAREGQLKGALAVAREVLRFLTGLEGTPALADTLPEPGPLPPLASLVEKAAARREDLRSLEFQVRAAEESRGIAKSGRYPTLSAEANYYAFSDNVPSGADWDLLLTLEVPIYEGGVASAKVREAESNIRTARLRLDERLRSVRLEVGRAYADVAALQGVLGSLSEVVTSAEENYDLVQAEYRRGIATNLEVLSVFNTLERARLDRDRARFQLKTAAVRLAVSGGALPGEDK